MLMIPMDLSAGIGEETEAILHQIFPGADDFEFKTLELDHQAKRQAEIASRQAFQMEKIFLWEIRSGEEVIGFAVLDNVQGKVQPITYVVVYDRKLAVVAVRIIRYREQYGGAVQDPSWLDQFKGFKADSKFLLGADIDGITGATLSANALTRGVKRISVYVSLLIGKD